MISSRDSNKTNNSTLPKKSEEQLQVKLMTISESGENEDKTAEQSTISQLNKDLTLTTTTLDWTSNE